MNNEQGRRPSVVQDDKRDNWLFWVITWPILTALLSSGLTWWVMQQQRATDLALRPPVAVMDLSEWILKAGSGATDEDRFKDGSIKAEEAAGKLQEQGVLVLDGRIVRGAPSNVMISTPEHENGDARK